MKRIVIFIFTFIIFIIGVNYTNAALVEGDDVYHFDFTMDQKVFANYYDYEATKCLLNYGRNNSEGYSEHFETAAYTGESFSTLYYGTTDLYTWNYDRSTIDKHDATGSNNFVADISHLDEDDCQLTRFGYNKIAVYFESDDEIPVRTDFTIDLTKNDYDTLNNYEKRIITQLLFYENDDLLPDVSSDSDIDGFPFDLTKNGKPVLTFDLDSNDDLFATVANPDELTTDDNITLTKEFLQNATLTPYGDVNLYDDFLFIFDNINIIVSHNDPVTEPTTPGEDPEEPINGSENSGDTSNDDSTSESDITPKSGSGDEKSAITNPQSGDNIILYLIMLFGSTTGIILNYLVKNKKEEL